MRNGDAIKERLRQKQEQKNSGGNGKKENKDREQKSMDKLDAQRQAIIASRKRGFIGVGKLLAGAERSLLIMLLHGFVQSVIYEDHDQSFEISKVPLFEILTPHQQLNIVATIARGLLLPETPLPPDDHLHWAGFIYLYEQLETFIACEIDFSSENGVYSDEETEKKPKAGTDVTYDKDFFSKEAEKLMEKAAISGRNSNQSLRRQKQMASIIQEDESADLEKIMKKQIHEKRERSQNESETTMEDLPQYYGKATDTAISKDKLYWFCWRRAVVHFVTERGEKYWEDGRLVNLWAIAKGQRIPIETERSHQPWDLLISHIMCELIVLSEEDDGFLYGRVNEATWARTILIRKRARHAHRQFAPTWSFKQGLHELATILTLTDPSPYALEYIHDIGIEGPECWLFDEGSRNDKPFNMLPQDVEQEVSDYFAQQPVASSAVQTNETMDEEGATLGQFALSSSPASEQQRITSIRIRALQGRLARNWTWHWHRMMNDPDVGFNYAHNDDRICALDR